MSMVSSFKRISFSFNFSFYFKILVIVVGEKWVPCPKRVGEKWLPIQNSAVRSGYPSKTWLLTAEFWSGTHFWQPSFGLVTISHWHILDRMPFFTDDYYEDFKIKLKINLKEIYLKLDTILIVFLGIFYVIYVKIPSTLGETCHIEQFLKSSIALQDLSSSDP